MSLLLLFHGVLTGPVDADLIVTEVDDALSASATLGIIANVTSAEVYDVASASGTVEITASAAISEANDTLNSSTMLALAAILAIFESDDIPSGSGTVDIVGSLSVIEGNDALVASVNLTVAAFLTITEGDDTPSASALMPVGHLRRGGDEGWVLYEKRQLEWERQLRRIIDRSWQIANHQIDPVTFEPIPPPDHGAVIGELIRQAQAFDRMRAESFVAEQEGRQEEEAISLLLLTE